jgi:hypothetical protein
MSGEIKLKISILFVILIPLSLAAQETKNWDNQMYLGNKVAFGKNRWKFSGELQTRLKNNLQSLDNWFLEFTATYMIAKHFEIVPDFRFTVKPEKLEYRPGFGILYKYTTTQIQFVNQVKWQIDIGTDGRTGNAMREVVFLNHKFTDKIVSTMVAGFIYRWWHDWNGFQYVRVGPGLSYVFDNQHILNFSYFVGVENCFGNWQWAGIPVIQLVINITKSYKFIPAYYFDF